MISLRGKGLYAVTTYKQLEISDTISLRGQALYAAMAYRQLGDIPNYIDDRCQASEGVPLQS